MAAGTAFTVMGVVVLQPDEKVSVMVAVPTATPDTTPLADPTVATEVLLDVHVPLSASLRVVVEPTQAVTVPVVAGAGFTVSVIVAVEVNPLPSVAVSV
jgi:hypothetical protein